MKKGANDAMNNRALRSMFQYGVVVRCRIKELCHPVPAPPEDRALLRPWTYIIQVLT